MNDAQQAADALEGFANGPARDAADALAEAFEQAGNRIAGSLERAAQSGELSFNGLAESVLSDLARIAVNELITAPLQGAVSALTSTITGSVSGKSAPVTVNLSLPPTSGKTTAPPASSAQIASQVAQVVSRVQNRN